MSHQGFLPYQQKCRAEENTAESKQIGLQAAFSGHPWLDMSLINLRNLLGHPWANGHPWLKKFLMFIGVINLAHTVSVVLIQETQRECKKAEEKQIFCMVSSPSVSKLELRSFIYVCHCMWPFVVPVHRSKHGAKHLHGTKDFMWYMKSNRSSPTCLSGWQEFIWI